MILLLRTVPLDALNETSFSNLIREFVDAATHWSDATTSMSKLLKEHRNIEDSSVEEDLGIKIKV